MSKRKKITENVKYNLARLNNQYLVLRNAIAITFLFFAFWILTFIDVRTNLAKFTMVLIGLIVIILAILLIVEFFVKTIRLQVEPKIKRYSALVSLNAVFGLVLPLKLINITLFNVVFYLKHMENSGTFFCEVRNSIVHYYFQNNVYSYVSNLVFWVLVLSVALFLFGGLLEKISKK